MASNPFAKATVGIAAIMQRVNKIVSNLETQAGKVHNRTSKMNSQKGYIPQSMTSAFSRDLEALYREVDDLTNTLPDFWALINPFYTKSK